MVTVSSVPFVDVVISHAYYAIVYCPSGLGHWMLQAVEAHTCIMTSYVVSMTLKRMGWPLR
jgi:hypothetical protein